MANISNQKMDGIRDFISFVKTGRSKRTHKRTGKLKRKYKKMEMRMPIEIVKEAAKIANNEISKNFKQRVFHSDHLMD